MSARLGQLKKKNEVNGCKTCEKRSGGQIRLSQAQTLAPRLGQGVKMAVIDTGLDHPAFAGRLAPTAEWYDFVGGDATPSEAGVLGTDRGYGHGTAVAGVILQVAPKVTILPIRVLKRDGSGDVTDVASAIAWVVAKGADVINLSLGTTTNVAALQTMVDYATSQGVYVISSAGNTGAGNLTFPAANANVGTGASKNLAIGVGSVNASDLKSSFSNYGDRLELVAPGEAIQTLAPNGGVTSWSGTSFATPIVSGALALGLGQPLLATTRQAEHIDATATNISVKNPGYLLGFGRLNVEAYGRKALGL